MNFKKLILVTVTIIGVLLIIIFQRGLNISSIKEVSPNNNSQPVVQIVSTTPSPLEDGTVLPNQSIELAFNLPLWNPDELKIGIEPALEVKISLSEDRKLAKITPVNGYELGQGYTLFIKSDSNFEERDEVGEIKKLQLGQEIIYHFKTINYKGI